MAPTIEPMLARLVRELPDGGFLYEPKWDGFRCIAGRHNEVVELHSRHGRPLARYFPEVVTAVGSLRARQVLLDGELLAIRDGAFEFAALMARLHPAASRVMTLARETPAVYVAFDVLELEGRSLLEESFEHRRAMLEREVPYGEGAVRLTPITADPSEARKWLGHRLGGGVDGVMAKPRDMPYEPGKRRMLKVKLERTADCVVAGTRPVPGEAAVASLLLALYGGSDELVHVGVASAFKRPQREEIWRRLLPLAVALEDHPWRNGYLVGGGPMGRLGGAAGRWTPEMELDWLPLRPDIVCEVGYDQVDGARFRHPARFRRWRPDREPRSCRLEQLAQPAPAMTLERT